MQKTTLWKRAICLLLSVVMLAGMIPFGGISEAMVQKADAASFAVNTSNFKTTLPMVPSSLRENKTFMDSYVRTSNSKLSLNSYFKRTIDKKVKGASETLPVGTVKSSSSSSHWMAQYQWYPSDAQWSALKSNSVYFETTLIPDYHSVWLFHDGHWTDAYLQIRHGEWDGEAEYDYSWAGLRTGKLVWGKSTERYERTTLNFAERLNMNEFDQGNHVPITLTMKQLGGQACGMPEVSGTVLYMTENTYPSISDIRLYKDEAATQEFGTYTKFEDGKDITAYVALYFSDNVRLSDNAASDSNLKLKVEGAYAAGSVGYEVDSKFTVDAPLVRLEGNKMVFKFSIPAKQKNNSNTSVIITGIDKNQTFDGGINEQHDLYIYDMNGSKVDTFSLKASHVTSYSGNSLDWNYSDTSTKGYYFDNVDPTLQSVSMTGSMITGESTKQPTSWEANSTNRGSTFAGVGDTLGFQVSFSEPVTYIGDLQATLNINDANGNPVVLKVDRSSQTNLVFKKFTVTEGMNPEGKRILIKSITGGTITDRAGNTLKLDTSSNVKAPAQQIYLDLQAPSVSTTHTETNGVYITNNETGMAGEIFTFPVVFKEDSSKASSPYISMINELPVSFSLVTPGKSVAFDWYVDNTQQTDPSKFKNSGNTASAEGSSKYQCVTKISDGVQYYLHIRLSDGINYAGYSFGGASDSGIFFNGSLYFYASDWAGNMVVSSAYPVQHQVDTSSPVGSIDGNPQWDVDYTNYKLTFNGTFTVKDNYGVQSVTYRWKYRYLNDGSYGEWIDGTSETFTAVDGALMKDGTLSVASGLVNRATKTVSMSVGFNPNETSLDRAGQVMLEITFEDLHGGIGSAESAVVDFDFTKPTPHYTIETGSPENPLETVNLALGKATSSVDGINPRTLVLIRQKDDDKSYLLYDPITYEDTNGDLINDSTTDQYYPDGVNLFKVMYDYAQSADENATLDMLGTWYHVVYDDIYNGQASNVFAAQRLTSEDRGADHRDEVLIDYLLGYGKFEIYLVTAQFSTHPYQHIPNGSTTANDVVYTFDPAQAVIQPYTVYVDNYAMFQPEIVSVTDVQGNDLSDKLGYTLIGGKTYPTLNGVQVTYKVSNISDREDITGQTYGFLPLDYSNSYATLAYYGNRPDVSSMEEEDAYSPIDSVNYPLTPTADGVQSIMLDDTELEKTYGTGWYKFSFTVTNVNGQTDMDRVWLFIDHSELDLTLDTYYKSYSYGRYKNVVRDGKSNSLFENNAEDYADGGVVLSMAETPTGFTETTYLRFSRSLRDAAKDFGNIVTDDVQICVRNATYDALNPNGTSDSILVDSSRETPYMTQENITGQYLPSDRLCYYYKPVLVDGYTEGAYGSSHSWYIYSDLYTTLTLPMLDGYNLIVCELTNTNGTVSTYEIPVFVHGYSEDWYVDYVTSTNEKDLVSSVTVFANVPSDPAMEESVFLYGPAVERGGKPSDEYTLYKDVENVSFFLLDRNGNLSHRKFSLTDEDGNIIDVDGTAPEYLFTSGEFRGHLYDFSIEVQDYDSPIDVENLSVTFDTDYSAVLMNLTGINRIQNQQTVTAPIPVDTTDGVWEEYDTDNYGIFRTEIISNGQNEEYGYYEAEIHVWATWKVDDECNGNYGFEYTDENQQTQFYDVPRWTVTANVPDVYGNTSSDLVEAYSSYYDSIYASPYTFWNAIEREGNYWLDYDYPFSEDGRLGMVTEAPMAAIDGYGIDVNEQKRVDNNGQLLYQTLASMIVEDGIYEVKVTDLFGNTTPIEVYVNSFGELGVSVTYSTVEPTNQPVTVYATTTGNAQKITSITSASGVVGTVDPNDPHNASITVSENDVITIVTDGQIADDDGNPSGEYIQRVVRVDNIDTVMDPTYLRWFDFMYDDLVFTGSESSIEGEVTVWLECDTEHIIPINGDDKYTFPVGSKAGDSYTFEYMDVAGNTGSITATLPCDITGEPDMDAPDVLVSVYGMRFNAFAQLGELLNPTGAELYEGFADESTSTSYAGYKGYVSQKFRFNLTITDTSATKVIVVPAGSAAPTDYASATQGSMVDGVELSVSRNGRTAALTVTKNTEFDIYVIDDSTYKNDNTNAILGVIVDGIDDKAPVVDVEYSVGKDENGYTIVIADFVPVADADPNDPKDDHDDVAELTPLTMDGLLSKLVYVPSGEYERVPVIGEDGYQMTDENGNLLFEMQPVMVPVIRYYTIFADNGEQPFNYTDGYGNPGFAQAIVKGMSTSAAVVQSVSWYGTVANASPSTSAPVNRNVTAMLVLSKPLSDVKLYAYNASGENKCGELLDPSVPVKVSFTGTNVYVSYEQNVDRMIVVEFTASASGRKGYYTLPKVNCIDREAPVVLENTIQVDLADNKRSAVITFETNEKALMSQNSAAGLTTTHKLVVTDAKAKTLQFTDAAGNITNYTMTRNSVVDNSYLKVEYSVNVDHSDVTYKPIDFKLDAGQTIFIRPSKNVAVTFDGFDRGTVQANVWAEMKLSDEAGVHMMQFTDLYTGDVTYGVIAIQPKDNVAPVLTLATSTIILNEDATVEQMMAAIHSGVTATDDVDGDIADKVTVTGHPTAVESGLYSLIYTVSDTAGNSVSEFRTLYIMAEGTPLLKINGEAATPYGKVVMSTKDFELELVNFDDSQPYVIKYRSGIKSVGQVKYYSTMVENLKFSVTEPGHYTVYIRLQDRVEYVTYIYVEE